MPLRTLFRVFFQSRFGDEAVQKLSETRAIRRVAQLIVYGIRKGEIAAKDSQDRLQSMQRTFSTEVKDGFKKLKDDVKREERK